ncbi:MAG: YceI family protein [Saprospiraceae bacterium]|nr:YceI family protein [Saprospiraceae bacterium]
MLSVLNKHTFTLNSHVAMEQFCSSFKTNYVMKKHSSLPVFTGVLFVLIAVLLVRCNGSAGDKAPATEEEIALADTSTAPLNMDTTQLLAETVPAVEEAPAAPKTAAPPAAKPVVKKTPVVAKTNTTQQKPASKTPPVSLPETKTPDVTPPASTPTPKAEPQITPKPAPTPAPAPKSPVVKYVAFSFTSTKAIIKGSSSLHAWESNITQIEGKGSFETKDDALIAVKDVEIKIAVKGIKSKEGKQMDNKTYDTFKSDENPYIIYSISNAVVKVNDSNQVTIEALGKLSMAGITQSVPLSATGKKLPNGDLQLSLSKKIKMTDYKMEPPVMLLGTIKVGNEVTLEFDFVLARKS